MNDKRDYLVTIGLFLCLVLVAPTQAGTVLDGVKERDSVRCGARDNIPGFSYLDSTGSRVGFDIDFCRAVAAAVLGDATKVEYTTLDAADRIPALKENRVDVVAALTTWTFSRDTDGVEFAGTNYYDGQGFLTSRSSGLRTILAAPAGTKVCVSKNSTSANNLADYIAKHKLQLEIVALDQDSVEARASLESGACQVLTSDRVQLAATREGMADKGNFFLLPDVISKEPLGLAVPEGDQQWSDIVRWVLFATIEAEEREITSSNLESRRETGDPTIQFMLGATPGVGAALGLDDAWVSRVIGRVGNYGEIFDRHLGENGQYKLPRGINDLWSRGGLMYSPPMR